MTTLDDLRNRAIQTACRSLKDPGPPLNPIVFTEKGSALLDGEKAMKDAGNAALSFLKEIDSTIRPSLYCLFTTHILEVPGKEPVTGIAIVSGGRGLPPQQSKFFVFFQMGDTITFEDPPELFEIGPSPNLFEYFADADSDVPEWFWSPHEDRSDWEIK